MGLFSRKKKEPEKVYVDYVPGYAELKEWYCRNITIPKYLREHFSDYVSYKVINPVIGDLNGRVCSTTVDVMLKMNEVVRHTFRQYEITAPIIIERKMDEEDAAEFYAGKFMMEQLSEMIDWIVEVEEDEIYTEIVLPEDEEVTGLIIDQIAEHMECFIDERDNTIGFVVEEKENA